LAERGSKGYEDLQLSALRSVKITGANRIAKVLPETGHDDLMSPAKQYPMGGGGPQWKIKKNQPAQIPHRDARR
jgi:hypothetical protein